MIMVFVTIGDERRRFDAADEPWINQQIGRRRNDGVPVCARVEVNQGDLNMTLATVGCAQGGGGGGNRRPNDQEQRIFDLWTHFRLNDLDFSGGNLVAFLKQLRNAL